MGAAFMECVVVFKYALGEVVYGIERHITIAEAKTMKFGYVEGF